MSMMGLQASVLHSTIAINNKRLDRYLYKALRNKRIILVTNSKHHKNDKGKHFWREARIWNPKIQLISFSPSLKLLSSYIRVPAR